MTSEICLEHVKDNRYQPVDCETGEPVNPCGKVSKDGRRVKRAPSKYNLFMKECLHREKGIITERFKKCASEYKKK